MQPPLIDWSCNGTVDTLFECSSQTPFRRPVQRTASSEGYAPLPDCTGGAQCPRQGEILLCINSLICAKGVFRSQSPRALNYLTEKCFLIQPTGVASPLYVCGLFVILISYTPTVYCRYVSLSSKPPTTCHQAKSFIFSYRLLHQSCLQLNSFFKVFSRWLVVGGRCRCRPLSAVPFLSQPSVSTRPFLAKLCPLPLPRRFSQTYPSISVQTLQTNASFGLSPIACLIKRQLLPLRDFHEAVPCCILLRIRLPVPGFLFAVQFEFSGSTVGIFEEAKNISDLF